MELTDRELAIRWWDRLKASEKREHANKHNLPYRRITLKTIYFIWKSQDHNK